MIHSITIRNYKSVVDATAKLPAFGAIVGLNAAGKSNLISVIEFTRLLVIGMELRDCAERYASTAEELFNLREDNFSKPFDFEFELSADSDSKYTFGISVALRQTPNLASNLFISNEYLKSGWGNDSQLIYKRSRDGSIKTAIPGENIPTTINVSSDSLFITVYDTPDTEKVKEIFRKITIISSDVRRLRTSSYLARDGAQLLRTDHISNLIGTVMKNPNLCNDFLKIIKKLLPNFTDFKEIRVEGVEKVRGKEIVVLMQERALQRELSSHSFSEGDLRTLAIVATALDRPEVSSLFIEEIENGMHPERARLLVEYLLTFSKVKELQVNFTTHSPLIINDMNPHHVLFVEKNDKGTHFELLSDSEDVTKIKDLLKSGAKLSDYLTSKTKY